MNEAVKDSQLSLFFMYGEDTDLPIVVKVISYGQGIKSPSPFLHAAVPELSMFTICI